MHILEVYLESGGFDYRLIRGGISVYLWNLTRAFKARGHRTSILSALNGQHDYLVSQHGLRAIDYRRQWECPIAADPRIWGDRMDQPLTLDTRAFHLEVDGTDFFYLSNDFLNLYPDTYYPPYEGKGTDPGFFKPLIFQLEAVHFINHWFGREDLLIHAHEPFYQHLLPAAFAGQPGKTMISTVQSNMPITKQVYGPETREALRQIGCNPDRVPTAPTLPDTLFNRCLDHYLPRTHLSYPYPADYLSLFDLVLADSDGIDFLSDGHLDFYTGFYGTAFRARFVQLPVHRAYQAGRSRLFVGGCGLGAAWLDPDRIPADRQAVLETLGLDPALPTFFHSARYAPNHKGQVELILAVRQFLERGGRGNFILRCITEAGVPDPRFAALASDFADMVYFTSAMQTEAELMAMADASDFALFPSKFEMDTFLIAQGEAMACGCVPIASDQLGMEHWRHGRGATGQADRTGLSVIRSFLEEDPALVSSICAALNAAVALRADQPGYAEMSARARACARGFGWQVAGDLHLAAFAEAQQRAAQPSAQGELPPAPPPPPPGDWQSVAREAGQIIDLRHQLGSAVPELTFRAGELAYHCPAAAVTAFHWTGTTFSEHALTPLPAGGGFAGGGFADESIFLLVTMANGDQFWDGLVPLDRVPA